MWIAEETEGNALLHNSNRQALMRALKAESETWPKNRTSCWHIWMIDPKMDSAFLANLIRDTFSFRDITKQKDTFEIIYIRNGKKIPEPHKVVQRNRDPSPNEWSVG
jgi:hypothetical protein